MDLRTPLGRVKGLGSAKSGSHHWWMQRVTALALIPLVIWFILNVIKASTGADRFIDIFANPFNAIGMVLFICVALYHGAMGFKVIVEDYIHCGCGKNFLIIGANFFTAVTAVAAVLAVITFHTGGAKTVKPAGKENCPYGSHQKADGTKYENCDKHKR